MKLYLCGKFNPTNLIKCLKKLVNYYSLDTALEICQKVGDVHGQYFLMEQ